LAVSLPVIEGFGGTQEKPVMEAFRLREGTKSPYLAVWQQPATFIRDTYATSTLQRQRTRDEIGRDLFEIIWNDDHTKRMGTKLRADAGTALMRLGAKPVRRLSLALWLGRDQDLENPAAFVDWFDNEYPLDGTDLHGFYLRDLPEYIVPSEPMQGILWTDRPTNQDIIDVIKPADGEIRQKLDVPSTTPPKASEADAAGDSEPTDEDLLWTRDFCAYSLRDANISRITQAVVAELEKRRIVLPDSEALIRRCVTALLVGHLVLQGPPGTGKTTLARVLAEAFRVSLLESTATTEWAPFHVVGGLRPASDGSLQPSYGKVADAALKCAVHVRADVMAESAGDDAGQSSRLQGAWLLIDELNRADIDKAIGSLYTMLSSCDPINLERSPIDLWFESEGRQQLWVPARFRIIAAMNDLDTSFVNPISQGLTRRFQFITIGAPAGSSGDDLNAETAASLATAHEWLSSTYGAVLTLSARDDITANVQDQILTLQSLVSDLRRASDTAAGWPVGTAQVVDVLRVLLLQTVSGVAGQEALDWAVADRLVPQMGQLDEQQLIRVSELFDQADLPQARAALQHLVNPHGT
jgi:MoxR-like ATPase